MPISSRQIDGIFVPTKISTITMAMASAEEGRLSHHEGRSFIAQDAQEEWDGKSIRPNALHEADIFYSSFFHRPIRLPPESESSSSSSSANDGNTSSSFLTQISTFSLPSVNNKPRNERICLGGHRETVFGVAFSPDGIYFATASQDSTIAIWSVKTHRLVMTLKEGMDVKFECLRVAWSIGRGSQSLGGGSNEKYLLASAGADGVARLWSAYVPASMTAVDDTNNNNNGEGREEQLKWQCVGILDHYMLENEARKGNNSNVQEDEDDDDEDENDRPQIYALQFIQGKKKTSNTNNNTECTNSALLLTSTNDCVYLWDILAIDDCNGSVKDSSTSGINLRKFHLNTMIQFSHINDTTRYNINTFGGERNPGNALYVFDASYCETNELLGVALSDGTCRVLSSCEDDIDISNTNGGGGEKRVSYRERCVVGLPPGYFGNNRGGGSGGHLTALSWDTSGTRLATCLSSGRVVLWSIDGAKDAIDGKDIMLQPSCMSIFEGGKCTLFDSSFVFVY